MGTINISNLYFRYNKMPKPIFDHFNLDIDDSWRLGLIGRNGRGKTTFLRILLGQLEATGKVQTNLTFKYFPQAVLHPSQTTRETLATISGLGLSDFWQIEVELDKLQVDSSVLERPFNSLSPGEQTKALLAALFSDNDTFQLIDEPTNHLDMEGRQVVADYLKAKHGFIVVSHDRYFLDQVINHVLSIDRAKIQLFTGNYKTWQREFEHRNKFEVQRKHELQSEIKRLEKTAEKTRRWSENTEGQKSQAAYKGQGHVNLDKGFLGHKAAKMMKRSKGIAERTKREINEKQSLLKNIDEKAKLTLNYIELKKRPLLQVDSFQVSRNGEALNSPISFSITDYQRLALTAPNGFGKSTIIKAILGDKKLISSGEVTLASGLKISYVSQDFEAISGSIERYAEQSGISLEVFLNGLRKLGFEREAFNHDISEMSLGQKRKIALSRSLAKPANLYIWDEPLNYLDVITRQQIEELILEVNPPMLLIDHDADFVEHITNQASIKLARPEND